jgi:hypothetical protein
MKVLEVLAGAVIAVLTVLILIVGSVFAVGSIGRYLKGKTM